MKQLFLIFLLFAFNSQAQDKVLKNKSTDEYYFDLLPVQVQYRYEDTTEQSRANRQYQSYGIGLQILKYRFDLEMNQIKESTGNASLKIEQSVQEIDLAAGYSFLNLSDANQRYKLNFFGQVWLGQTQTTINTKLLTSETNTKSDKDAVVGAGITVVGRISYFIAAVDFKMLNSKNMSPQSVPVFSIKIGAGIPF